MQLCSLLSGQILLCLATSGPRNRGIHHHGRLKLSDGWFQGELLNQDYDGRSYAFVG